jgi:hypothetical protein
MYKTLFLSILSTIFIGCSSTSALKHFQKDEIYTKSMQYSQKADLLYKNEQKAILWAVYLNNLDEKEFTTKEEFFIVSLYFIDSDTQSLDENSYDFTLNGKTYKSIEKIEKDDPKYKDLLSRNSWGSYYLIKFDELKKIYDLNLKLSNPNTSTVLKFVK